MVFSAGYRSVIDRYFEVSLYLLIVTGFATLASTGKLDLPTLVFVSGALALRGYLLVRGRTLQIPERWTTYLTLGYVVLYTVDLFFLSGSFVTATVHLVLFVMVVKIFSVQRDRDHLYLAIIAFLSVLGAAILTVDAVFLVSFCIFLLLAASTFVSMEMRRSQESAGERSRTSPDSGRLSRSLFKTAAALALGVAFGSGLIFFVLPRLSTGYLSAYAPRNALVTGFSDEVRLGEIGEIQQSDTVVMHIQIDGDTLGAHDLKWRGVALKSFDGVRWSNPRQHTISVPRGLDNSFMLADRRVAPGKPLNLVRYRVLMEPIGANVFFLAPQTRWLAGDYRSVAVDEAGAVYNNDPNRSIGAYNAESNIGEPSAEQLRNAQGETPPWLAADYLQIPALDARLPALALEVTGKSATPYDKAVALERYFRANFGYSLQLTSTAQPDPLAYFLFVRKAGSCEYFASSMAVMLRSLGIPARVVNGFRGGEFNAVSGSYIVRARDAHSWVEAYFPGHGWISFDPTPAGGGPAPSAWNRAGLYVDAVREFWREWVINYDFAHQMNLSNSAITSGHHAFEGSRRWFRRRYDTLLASARRVQGTIERSPQRYGGWAIVAIVAGALLLNLGRLMRALRKRALLRDPARAPQESAGLWYEKMLRWARGRGWKKLPVQTPKEFAATIGDPEVRESVSAFTERYERARFGNSGDDAQALPELFGEMTRR